MFRFLIAMSVCCLATGCFSHPAIYPDHWAEAESSEDGSCPLIDGIYLNRGESAGSTRSPAWGGIASRSLAHILNGGAGVDTLPLWNKLGTTDSDPDTDPNVTVRLSLAEGRLQVTGIHADGASRSIELRLQSCSDGLLELDGDWDSDFEELGPVAPEFSRKTIEFGRAQDGSLLMRESKSALQWFLLSPAFGYTEAAWTRFAPAATPVANAAQVSP